LRDHVAARKNEETAGSVCFLAQRAVMSRANGQKKIKVIEGVDQIAGEADFQKTLKKQKKFKKGLTNEKKSSIITRSARRDG